MNVMLVEADQQRVRLLQNALHAVRFASINVVNVATLSDALRLLGECEFQIVLLNLNLPDSSGFETLSQVASKAGVPVVVVVDEEEEIIETATFGAQDYLVLKQINSELVWHAMMYAIERKRAEITSVELHASQLRAMENARLERGLSPSPLLLDSPGRSAGSRKHGQASLDLINRT